MNTCNALHPTDRIEIAERFDSALHRAECQDLPAVIAVYERHGGRPSFSGFLQRTDIDDTLAW